MVLYKLLPTKLSVAIKPLDGPVVNLSNWGFEWAGKSTWQLEQDHQMWSTLQRFILRDKYSAPVYSLVSQPLVLPRVVLVRAAASSGSIAAVSWLQLVTWSPASAPPPPGSAPSAPRSLSPAPSPGPASAPPPPPPPPPPPSPGTWPLCWGWWRWPRWRRSRRSQSGLGLQQCWAGTAARSAARPGPWS